MSRLKRPDPDSFSEQQQAVYQQMVSGPRGDAPGPLGIWLWRPELAQQAQSLGCYCRYNSSLPARLSELAIMVTARHWNAEYEWQVHKKFALEAGLAPSALEALRTGETPAFEKQDEYLVYHFATELLQNKKVSEATYSKTIEQLGSDSTVDLVGVLGYYGLISMTINVFEIDAPGPLELS